MKELVIGYDLCKDYCRISWFGESEEEPQDFAFSEDDNPYIIQNAVCKRKGEDVWLVGGIAYQTALFGDGQIVDKLLKIVSMNGFSTIDGVQYTSEDLLYHFLDETLKMVLKDRKADGISELMFTVQELDAVVLDTIMRCVKRLGIDRRRVHIISHTESFLFFVLSQKRELWSNLAVLYDLSGDGLNYYETEILRGMQPNVAYANRTFLEEGFSVDILDHAAGRRMADNIMSNCVERMLSKKMVSAAFLSGKGMDTCQQWGTHFLQTICQRRRVFYIENLFAKGAVLAGLERMRKTSAYPYRIMCEGRISVEITADVFRGMNKKTLTLSHIGDNWYETKEEFDIICDEADSIPLKVQKLNERYPAMVEIPLSELNTRGNKLTRFGVSLAFTQEDVFTVTVRDKGFGEFFPSSDRFIRKTFTIG
ncbi:MAG: hypothetical protein J6Z38_08065 [Lachnospiraceae bacterium]|nr:hypothetical protein [Lachnospiraceae bacterium]